MTMERLIDADKLLKTPLRIVGEIGGKYHCETIPVKVIDKAPTINPEDLQPHGKWESVENPIWPAHSHDKCSVCGWWNTRNALCYDGGHKPGHSLNYCPNCGARMREGIGHEVN